MKKGFTLIELLGVITLIAIIALITIPAVGSIIEKNKNNISKSQTTLIIKAAKSYVAEDPFNIPSCINVSTLQNKGYLENDNTLKGYVSISDGTYTYTYSETDNSSCK